MCWSSFVLLGCSTPPPLPLLPSATYILSSMRAHPILTPSAFIFQLTKQLYELRWPSTCFVSNRVLLHTDVKRALNTTMTQPGFAHKTVFRQRYLPAPVDGHFLLLGRLHSCRSSVSIRWMAMTNRLEVDRLNGERTTRNETAKWTVGTTRTNARTATN